LKNENDSVIIKRGEKIMDYSAILSKDKLNILITGDSLSYNRYGYYDTPKENAFNCSPGMPSWAFSLRNRLYFTDEQFVYADDLVFPCKSVAGIDSTSADLYAELFPTKIRTLFPRGDISFSIPVSGDQVVLYFQNRHEGYCTFDIEIDGETKATNVSNRTTPERFNGFEPMLICLEYKNRESHTVTLKNIRGNNPKITVCACGAKYKNITMSGKGNQCVSFFNENFDERIADVCPDFIIMTLSANDRARISLNEYELELKKLLENIFGKLPNSKLLFLIPPSSRDPDDAENNTTPYTSDTVSAKYNDVTYKVCRDYDADIFDISSLFKEQDISSWRFDSIHLNKNGNNILLEALITKLNI
jgi:hypothetical protein